MPGRTCSEGAARSLRSSARRAWANPALIAELKQTALAPPEEGLPPLWLEGRCLELSVNASYWLFIDMFREFFGFQTQDDD